LLGLLALSSLILLNATPASAMVVPAGGQAYGVQPTNEVLYFGEADPSNVLNLSSPETFANAAGNPVVHSSNIYAIYWDPAGVAYDGDWETIINGFLKEAATESGSLGNVFAVDAQYTDTSNTGASYKSVFRGAYHDTEPYPTPAGCSDSEKGAYITTTCLSDQQIQTQVSNFVAGHNLIRGMNSIFVVLTPPQVEVCLESGASAKSCSESEGSKGLCSYHSAITPTSPTTGDGNTILYDVLPWTAGGLDDSHLPAADRGLGSLCQDGNWDQSAPWLDSTQEETGADTDKRTEQEPNQVPHTSPDGTYDGALADLIVNNLAIDLQNTITDPLLNAWHDNAGFEEGDECRNDFLPTVGGAVAPLEHTNAGSLSNQTFGEASYYINDSFDLAALKLAYPGVPCIHGVSLVPAFTTPSRVHSGDIVGFDGSESNVTLDGGTGYTGTTPHAVYPTYTWNFGDGSPQVTGFAPGSPALNSPANSPCAAPWVTPCAASSYHSYQYGGAYNVTLTITDIAGNTATVSNPIIVEGPPAPGSETPGESGSGGSGSGSSGSGAGTSGSGSKSGSSTTVIPAPIATAAAASRSLSAALRKGLTIRYTVNEQVAGHFEVLLAARIARQLGIQGSKAQGLPAGSAPAVVIAHAILVTTKGGQNTVRIKFSKRTAARLHRLHTVTLTLRLIVHNAATQNPQSTTATRTIVLHN
jgi:hypothetical protein